MHGTTSFELFDYVSILLRLIHNVSLFAEASTMGAMTFLKLGSHASSVLTQEQDVRVYLVGDLHRVATCVMLFTSSVSCCDVAAPVALEGLAALEPELVPLICTSWPTWSLSSAVLPVSLYTLPLSALRV